MHIKKYQQYGPPNIKSKTGPWCANDVTPLLAEGCKSGQVRRLKSTS